MNKQRKPAPADLFRPWNGMKGRKPAGWNIYPAPVEDVRLLRRMRPTWNKEQWIAQRDEAAQQARAWAGYFARLHARALKVYGEAGRWINYGSGWDGWPPDARTKMRNAASMGQAWADLAHQCHRAAGRQRYTFTLPAGVYSIAWSH